MCRSVSRVEVCLGGECELERLRSLWLPTARTVRRSVAVSDRRIVGSLDRWIIGSLDHWIVGSLDHWIVGYSSRSEASLPLLLPTFPPTTTEAL